MLLAMPPLTYVAVDPAALRHNLAQARTLLEPATQLMAVVKANAYGHGLVLAASVFAESGADWLGVSTLEEGAALRAAGLHLPILVFLPCPPEQAADLIAHRLSATVVGEESLVALARAAEIAQRPAHYQFYLDAGLGRPGVDDLPRLMEIASGFPLLVLDGLYMHLDAAAAPRLGPLETLKPGAEFRLFAATAHEITDRLLGTRVPLHAAASALALTRPEARLDLVRLGTLLYGQYPASVPPAARSLDLRPARSLRSTVAWRSNSSACSSANSAAVIQNARRCQEPSGTRSKSGFSIQRSIHPRQKSSSTMGTSRTARAMRIARASGY